MADRHADVVVEQVLQIEALGLGGVDPLDLLDQRAQLAVLAQASGSAHPELLQSAELAPLLGAGVRLFVDVAPHARQARRIGRDRNHREHRDGGTHEPCVPEPQATGEHRHRQAQGTAYGPADIAEPGDSSRRRRGHDDE